MITVTLDGTPYTGTAEDIVRVLHKRSRAQCPNDRQWMKEAAHRITMMNGTMVRTNTFANFVQDLIAHDLLEMLSKGE